MKVLSVQDIDWFDKSLWHDHGYIYLIYDGQHYKIGKAINIEKRLKELQTSAPQELKVVWSMRSLACRRTEAYLHRKFHPKKTRKRGEWFALTPSDVEWFKKQDARYIDGMALYGPVCGMCGAQNRQKCTCPVLPPKPTKPALKTRHFSYTHMTARDGTELERCRHCGKWFKSHGKYIYCYSCKDMANDLDRLTEDLF